MMASLSTAINLTTPKHTSDLMMNTETQTMQEFFTESEWDLIYNFIGNALDDDNFDADDVYSIRNKIHTLFAD